jgi:quinol monooxygenase YgiN
MRLVQATLKKDALPMLRQLYEEKVIPSLQITKGCLHCSLLQSVSHPQESVSLTLWSSRGTADAYEASGPFSKLLEEASQYFEGSSEWGLHLSSDLSLQYDPVPEPPVIRTFDIPAERSSSILPRVPSSLVYIRIVTPQIRHGKTEEFKKLFTEEVLPHLRAAAGCIHASLIENVKQQGQLLSLNVWASKQNADEYEHSGQFSVLTKKVEHCFSEMYQWKKQIEQETHRRTVTSEEMTVDGYNVITGKTFL